MDKEWAEANNATKPQDFKNKEENFAVRNANGTGPFVLVSREPDVKTVLKRNDAYWGSGEVPLEITELDLHADQAGRDARRRAALGRGRLRPGRAGAGHRAAEERRRSCSVTTGPENRTIFFGMDVGSTELKTDNVKGKNPFADKRVRQAMNMAINRQAIQRVVMRGQSVPAGVDRRRRSSTATPRSSTRRRRSTSPRPRRCSPRPAIRTASRSRCTARTTATSMTRAICQAAVGMLGQIGIKANLVSQSKSLHFPLIQKNPPETEFYLLGWGVPTYDSRVHLHLPLPHARRASSAAGTRLRYSNPEVDKQDRVPVDRDRHGQAQRHDRGDLGQKLQDETLYLPIHHQMLALRDEERPRHAGATRRTAQAEVVSSRARRRLQDNPRADVQRRTGTVLRPRGPRRSASARPRMTALK